MSAPLLPAPRQGFTLIEMLAAIAVLAVLVLMIVQITDGTARSVTHENRQIDTDTEARMIFNRLALDFARMLKRPDLDYASFKQPAGVLPARYRDADGKPVPVPANLQPGNDRMAFYSESRGSFPGSSQPTGEARSPVSVIGYQIVPDPATGTPGLGRRSIGLGWEPEAGGAWKSVAHLPVRLDEAWSDLFSDATAFPGVADSVFRLEYLYLLKPHGNKAARLSLVPWNDDPGLTPPHTAVDGFRDVAAIIVTIALLDRHASALVHDYTALASALPDAAADADGNAQGVAAAWGAIVRGAGFAEKVGIPPVAAAGIRIYERHFPLDSNP